MLKHCTVTLKPREQGGIGQLLNAQKNSESMKRRIATDWQKVKIFHAVISLNTLLCLNALPTIFSGCLTKLKSRSYHETKTTDPKGA